MQRTSKSILQIVIGFGGLLAVLTLVAFVANFQSRAQSPQIVGTTGEVTEIISNFTRSVDLFNFVVIFSFIGFFLSLLAIFMIVRMFLGRDADKNNAHEREVYSVTVAHEKQTQSLQDLVLNSQNITLQAVTALVNQNGLTKNAENALRHAFEAVDTLVNRTLPTLERLRSDAEMARLERNQVFESYKKSWETLHKQYTLLMEAQLSKDSRVDTVTPDTPAL